MTAQERLLEAIAAMEDALASALSAAATNSGSSLEEIESLLKLIIKKEILLEMLLEEGNSL